MAAPPPAPRPAGGAGGMGQTGAAGSGNAAAGAGGAPNTEMPNVQAPGAAGMTGGVSPGTASGGAAGMGAAGAPAAAGAPGAAGAGTDPSALCVGAVANMGACTVTCTDQCGVHDLGLRSCSCTNALYACASCAYTDTTNPLLTPPAAPLAPCALADDAQEDDETGCDVNERCQSIGRMAGATDGANRFCACLDNQWDCDTKPTGFP